MNHFSYGVGICCSEPGGAKVEAATLCHAAGVGALSRCQLRSNRAGRIETPLYRVVWTIVHYRDDESGETRDMTIAGSFKAYGEARKVTLSTLLWWDDGISWNIYAAYDEAAPAELDCRCGEKVIVHAIGQNGENFMVSVLEGRATESEIVPKAAGAMRF